MKFTDEQLAKLPKWAREIAETMDRDHSALAMRYYHLEGLFRGQQGEPTRVQVAYRRMTNNTPLYLSDHDAVEFSPLGPGKCPSVHVNLVDHVIRVNCASAILISPMASNACEILVRP